MGEVKENRVAMWLLSFTLAAGLGRHFLSKLSSDLVAMVAVVILTADST